MFKIVKNFFSFFLYNKANVELNEGAEDKVVENDIDHEKKISINNSTNTLDSVDNTKYICTWKKGVVTFNSTNYGLIDDNLYFQSNVVPSVLKLKVGDVVSYMSYQARKNENERIIKIKMFSESLWDNEDNGKEFVEKLKTDTETNLQCLNEDSTVVDSTEVDSTVVESIERILTGKVSHKKGNEIMITPVNVWCNLNYMESEFIPVIGDWVSLKAEVSVDSNVVNLAGEILDIKLIKPLLVRNGKGTITFIRKVKKRSFIGIIENEIKFSNKFCNLDFTPCLGDQVVYKAIESDQDSLKWRALHVQKVGESGMKKYFHEDNDLLKYKNDIVILGKTNLGSIEISDKKELVLFVKNKGLEAQTFLRGTFLSKTNQVKLKSPIYKNGFDIKPNEIITFKFVCNATYLGVNRELFIFVFKDFEIGKFFKFNVTVNKKENKLLPCEGITVTDDNTKVAYTWKNFDYSDALYGAKNKNSTRFYREPKKHMYKIPEDLFKIIVGETEVPRNRQCILEMIREFAPYLKNELTAENYKDRFHILLYVEEIYNIMCFKKYCMKNVILRKKNGYLVLDSNNFNDRIGLLNINNKVIVSQPWSEISSVHQIGYIHHVINNELFIKFHDSFHNNYDESDCDISFEPNRTPYIRCHIAVDKAFENLGSFWLFPYETTEKPSVVSLRKNHSKITDSNNIMVNVGDKTEYSHLILDDDPIVTSFNCDIDENGFVMPFQNKLEDVKLSTTHESNKLLDELDMKWFNSELNYLQKLTVVNALEARGRPFPYIIYGPPGTGKTMTLVEIVQQICHLISDSRILIGTASNSSADMICSYLIETGQFTPGELVRLLSLNRAVSQNFPEKLIPYCVTVYDPNIMRNQQEFLNVRMFEKDALWMQRVIIGTCSATGILHTLNIKQGHFSHIILDEACQATEPEALIPLTFLDLKRGSVILCGDPEQLYPVSTNAITYSFGFCLSLLERLINMNPYIRNKASFPNTDGYNPKFITRLRINYRSVPEILNLPSKLFYDSDLIAVVSQTEGTEAEIIKKFSLEVSIRTPPPAIIFHCISGQNYKEPSSSSWYNPLEIWQTVTYLKKLYAIGLSQKEIGIVTPYRSQIEKLTMLLSSLDILAPKIGSVEEFQGQERFVIILSTVRGTNKCRRNDDIRSTLGFLANPRRINVAISRARALLIIIGNAFALSLDPYWFSVIHYCVANKSFIGALPNKFNLE